MLAELLVLQMLTPDKRGSRFFGTGVVKFICLVNQHVYPMHVLWLLAQSMDEYPLIPAKDVDGKVVFHHRFGDLRDRSESVSPFKVESVLCGVLDRSVQLCATGNKADRRAQLEAVVIFIFHIDECFFAPNLCG